MIELQKSVFTNGFDKVISSSESIHEIHYETNVVCIVLAHSHVNVVTTVWHHTGMTKEGTFWIQIGEVQLQKWI